MSKDYRSCIDASYRMPEAKWYPPEGELLATTLRQVIDTRVADVFASRDAIIRKELLLMLANADREDTAERRAELEKMRDNHHKQYGELVVLKMELTITTQVR